MCLAEESTSRLLTGEVWNAPRHSERAYVTMGSSCER